MLVGKGWNKSEPGDPCSPERPRLFEQTVYRALCEDLVSETKAAELLQISARNLAAHRRMEIVNGDPGQ